GELFNPHFVGRHNKDAAFGITLDQREADPFSLLGAIKKDAAGLPGFRLFFDHDARVLDYVLQDRSCAKIVLTRDPLESYVSLEIARETGQWKLSDISKRKEAKVTFNLDNFQRHLETRNGFLSEIRTVLQRTGQTGFYLGYSDVGEIDVLNGLARYLGSEEEIKTVSKKTRKQNPSSLSEKVTNFAEMVEVLSTFDRFGTHRSYDFEPQRGGGVPNYVAASAPPLLYMPVANGLEGRLTEWLADLSDDALQTEFSQKSLRHWKKQNPGFRSFTVLRHPLPRAYQAYCDCVLTPADARLEELSDLLCKRYNVVQPDQNDSASVKDSFSQFLSFLKGNLAGQTSLRVEPCWASQTALLDGISSVQAPDFVFREEQMSRDLTRLVVDFDRTPPNLPQSASGATIALADIYDERLEKACFQAYRKDYFAFGFSEWSLG
ncbi:MAG: nodulation protein NodH, partial [Litoreibacter sp.]|nr:nodulation protein NodH [Litoreibacter sp.]